MILVNHKNKAQLKNIISKAVYTKDQSYIYFIERYDHQKDKVFYYIETFGYLKKEEIYLNYKEYFISRVNNLSDIDDVIIKIFKLTSASRKRWDNILTLEQATEQARAGRYK